MIKTLELIDGGFLGGGQIHILSILRNIDRSNFEVSVAADGRGLFAEEVKKLNIEFRDIFLPKIFRNRHLMSLLGFCKEGGFDIIHTHGGVAGFYGRMLKKHLPEITVIHTIHGIHYIHSKNPLRKFISLSIEQYLAKFTDLSVCVSESDYKEAIKLRIVQTGKTVVIRNGIDTAKFENNEKDTKLFESLGFKTGDFVIGQISRFDEQKNQNLIIRAVSELVKQHDDIKILFVGDGRKINSSRNLVKSYGIEDKVVFTGEKKDISDYYPLFDIFIFPTFWEGMPYVLLEAMASGLAVICSDIPCHREIASDNESALFVNPHDSSQLRNRILYLYNNINEIRRLGLKAKETALKFDEKHMVTEIENQYREVLKK